MTAFACTGLGAGSLHLRTQASRKSLHVAERPAALRKRSQVTNISSPAREPITLPSVIPDTAMIDEVSVSAILQLLEKATIPSGVGSH